MEKTITTREELNTAIAELRAYSISMCNATTTDDVCKHFIAAKDLLIAIYKYNIDKNVDKVTPDNK